MNNALTLNPIIAIQSSLFIKKGVGSKFLLPVGLLLIFALFVFYIFQVNQITTGGYLSGVYEEKLKVLSYENKGLEIELSRFYSPTGIEELVSNLNFEPLGKIHYIRVLEGTAVKK